MQININVPYAVIDNGMDKLIGKENAQAVAEGHFHSPMRIDPRTLPDWCKKFMDGDQLGVSVTLIDDLCVKCFIVTITCSQWKNKGLYGHLIDIADGFDFCLGVWDMDSCLYSYSSPIHKDFVTPSPLQLSMREDGVEYEITNKADINEFCSTGQFLDKYRISHGENLES